MKTSTKRLIREAFESLSRKFWNFYEDFYEWLFRIKPVGPTGEGVLRWGISRYRGPGITLEDGTQIKKGELVGELHTDNRVIIKLRSEFEDPVLFYVELLKRMRLSLSELEKICNSDPRLLAIKAFRGTTLLHEGARRLGFEIHPIERRFNEKLETKIQWFFLRKYMGESFQSKKGKKVISRRIWLSREKLKKIYGSQSIGK